MKLAVVGSRSFKDRKRLYKILDDNLNRIEMIITGGAKGADTFAHEWCQERGKPVMIFYPQWYLSDGTYDKGAGFKRNWNIIKSADKALIFWDGESTGTKNDIEICEKMGKPYKILSFQNEPEKPADMPAPEIDIPELDA